MNVTDSYMLQQMQQMAASMTALPQTGSKDKSESSSFQELMDKTQKDVQKPASKDENGKPVMKKWWEVTEEDIDAEYQKRAEEFKMDVETLKKYLERNMIREQLLRNKAIAVVVDSAVPVKPAVSEEEKPKKRSKKKEEAPAGDGQEEEKAE